jgi:hypothetical protein
MDGPVTLPSRHGLLLPRWLAITALASFIGRGRSAAIM